MAESEYNNDEVAAIVLAAGRSQRMGKFKPLLPFGNSTVLGHCIRNFTEAGIQLIVVVSADRAEQLTAYLRNPLITVVVNPDSSSAMSASIAIGAASVPASGKAILITPVDHPAVPTEVVKQLVERWRSGAPLVVPTFGGRGGHPVLIDCRFREELLELDPNGGLRAFLDQHSSDVTRLPVNSPYIARDIDTWDDYVALHTDVFGVPPSQAQVDEIAT